MFVLDTREHKNVNITTNSFNSNMRFEIGISFRWVVSRSKCGQQPKKQFSKTSQRGCASNAQRKYLVIWVSSVLLPDLPKYPQLRCARCGTVMGPHPIKKRVA